jgi:hypothetical protein
MSDEKPTPAESSNKSDRAPSIPAETDCPGSGGPPNQPVKVSLLDKLPIWISKNLRSRRSWGVLLRCWIASWVCFLLLLPDRSLNVLGNTCVYQTIRVRSFLIFLAIFSAFFTLLASFFLPATFPVQLFIIVSNTHFGSA